MHFQYRQNCGFLAARINITTNIAERIKGDLADPNENNVLSGNGSKVEIQQTPSLISWVKGAMSDLGLGLAWAALYFSVFTAWSNGQTIGKKICSIKVVRLDNKTLTLWESFNRYGGYGAGFATGLLGFLQLYWDPNRQAIQDKISETLVLRMEKINKTQKHSNDNIERITSAKDSSESNTKGSVTKTPQNDVAQESSFKI